MPRVRLLGPVDVVDNDGVLHAPGSALRRTLLALLALDAGRVVDADRLLDEAWDGSAPASGRRALRFHISRLRAELAIEDLIVTVGSGYRLDADTDTAMIEADLSRSNSEPEDLATLLALWRGQALTGCSHSAVLEHEQQRLDELRLTLSQRHFQRRLDVDDIGIIGDLTRLCLDRPLREDLWAILIAAHYRAHHQAEALRTYNLLRLNLRDELGVDPSPDLRHLEQQILDQDVPPPTQPASLSADVGSLSGNVSMSTSELHGRAAAATELHQMLGTHRLVTILGSGGVGKTRLALEVAYERRAVHEGGVWFCDLSSVSRPESIPYVVAETLDVNDHQGRSMTNSVASWLSAADALLVLDNCEQVSVAVRDLVDALLVACPHVRILATSRTPLRHDSEQRFLLEPLTPDTDAVELFWARSSLANPRLDRETHGAAATAICRMVDGIPLAVELAAVHCGALTPAEIAARISETHDLLRDDSGQRPDRQRTLAATIDWSIEALKSRDRRLLGELSVFSGGFTLSAAEGVCSSMPRADNGIFRSLETLVESSLVDMAIQPTGTARYRILEPIRQHVASKVPVEDRAAMSVSHARWFARRAHELQDALLSAAEAEAMIETTAELANFRQAKRWGVQNEPTTAARLVSGLLHYEVSRLHTEIAEWCEQTLDVLDADDPWFHSALAASTMGMAMNGRYDEVVVACNRLDETAVSPFLRDNAAILLAGAARARAGNLAPTERLASRALADGDLFMAALALGFLNRIEESLAVATQSGIPSAIAHANLHVARIAASEGRDVDAEIHLSRAIAGARSVSSWLPLARALAQWAIVSERLGLSTGEIERARDESDAIFRRSGIPEKTWTALLRQDTAKVLVEKSATSSGSGASYWVPRAVAQASAASSSAFIARSVSISRRMMRP